MKILEEFKLDEDSYVCLQKVLIDEKMIYACKSLRTNQTIFLRENSITGQLEKTEDEYIVEKMNQYRYAKSEDNISD